MKGRSTLAVGDRVRIKPDVARTAWNVPCNWGGMEGIVTGGGARVSGVRIYRVDTPQLESAFGGNDFTEGMLELAAGGVGDIL